MDARITSITLVVKNKAEVLEFYTEKVGFDKKTDYTNGVSQTYGTLKSLSA